MMCSVADMDLSWQEVITRLGPERSYWLLTIAPSGLPHAAPVWGAVVDDSWFFYSERATVKSRNLALDPRLVLHLPDGEDVVIVHGEAQDRGHPQEHPHVVAAFADKYTRLADQTLLPLADPAFDVLYVLRPTRAMMWRLDDYERSQRRWSAADT